MKQLVLLFTALVLGTTGTLAVSNENNVATSSAYRFNNSFIFVEGGITFSVYPDGEFDFYIDNRVNVGAQVNLGRANITFNSGFNYNPFVQYDDFGAVIQVENVPVFYDHFGRVAQIGDIFVNYRNGFVHRLGGMNVFYNNGIYAYHTGFINVFNRRYIHRPFHRFFIRPAIGFCLVNPRPYRRFYTPVRYTWYRPYRNNVRRAFAQIGRDHRYNRIRNERSRVYRNDRRVAVRQNTARRSNAIRSNRGVAQRNTAVSRNRNNTAQRNTVARGTQRNVSRDANFRSNRSQGNTVTRSRTTTVTRSTQARPATQGTVKRSSSVYTPKRSTVRQGTATRTSRSGNDGYRQTTRSTRSYSSTPRTSTNRSVQRSTPTSRNSNVGTRSTSRSSSVNRSTSRSSSRGNNTASRSTRRR